MRHQHRHRHGAQDAARDAAENELAQARMAIAAEHHEVGAGVGGVRQDRILHAGAATGYVFDLDRDAMARHLAGEIGLSEAVEQIRIATRQYAKRQQTWFRNRMKDWKWLEDDNISNLITQTT